MCGFIDVTTSQVTAETVVMLSDTFLSCDEPREYVRNHLKYPHYIMKMIETHFHWLFLLPCYFLLYLILIFLSVQLQKIRWLTNNNRLDWTTLPTTLSLSWKMPKSEFKIIVYHFRFYSLDILHVVSMIVHFLFDLLIDFILHFPSHFFPYISFYFIPFHLESIYKHTCAGLKTWRDPEATKGCVGISDLSLYSCDVLYTESKRRCWRLLDHFQLEV